MIGRRLRCSVHVSVNVRESWTKKPPLGGFNQSFYFCFQFFIFFKRHSHGNGFGWKFLFSPRPLSRSAAVYNSVIHFLWFTWYFSQNWSIWYTITPPIDLAALGNYLTKWYIVYRAVAIDNVSSPDCATNFKSVIWCPIYFKVPFRMPLEPQAYKCMLVIHKRLVRLVSRSIKVYLKGPKAR